MELENLTKQYEQYMKSKIDLDQKQAAYEEALANFNQASKIKSVSIDRAVEILNNLYRKHFYNFLTIPEYHIIHASFYTRGEDLIRNSDTHFIFTDGVGQIASKLRARTYDAILKKRYDEVRDKKSALDTSAKYLKKVQDRVETLEGELKELKSSREAIEKVVVKRREGSLRRKIAQRERGDDS